MTILRTVLLASLAAAAACSVSTDELKPKDPSECATGTKPCGYKCVSVLDPATGCGTIGSCQPCSGVDATCDPSNLTCQSAGAVCTGTQAQCDGAGACEDLATDPRHCGACGHACETGFSCAASVCDGPTMAAGNSARGIAFRTGVLYWVDDGNGGRLMSWDASSPSFGSAYANELAGQLDGRLGAPSVFRLAVDPNGLQIYTVGRSAADAEDFTVWSTTIGVPGKTRLFGDTYTIAASAIQGFAATAGGTIFLSRTDRIQPWIWTGPVPGLAPITSAAPATVHGITSSGARVWYGWSAGASGGALAFADAAGTEIVSASGIPGVPDRIAVLADGAELFWISEADGSVYRWPSASTPTLLRAGHPSLPTSADIVADGQGAYWVDRALGEVWEWRRDGQAFPIAKGVAPNGVAVGPAHVYFTDDRGLVQRVPK